MTEFNKQTSVHARMNIGDLTTVSVAPRGYNPSILINMRDNESLEISVTGDSDAATDEFKLFVEMLITAAIKANWNERYNGGHAYRSSERVTIEQLMEWKSMADTLAAVDNTSE